MWQINTTKKKENLQMLWFSHMEIEKIIVPVLKKKNQSGDNEVSQVWLWIPDLCGQQGGSEPAQGLCDRASGPRENDRNQDSDDGWACLLQNREKEKVIKAVEIFHLWLIIKG